MEHRRTGLVSLFLVMLLAGTAVPAAAQDEPRPVAFSLASSHIFNTKETAAVELTFQRVTALDFRVYRVSDPFRFFAQLRDPHQLGSPDPVVPEERTWLERIAAWKADRRDELRAFRRRQFSHAYRVAKREQQALAQVAQRRTIRHNTFAQVPLLNSQQLVASWREILPPLRDAEVRRLPLDLPGPGIYLVEAVSPPHKAYTVVMMSDVGLVAKTAPGQLLLFAANRFSGDPIANCRVEAYLDQKPVGNGTTSADGVLTLPLQKAEADALVAVAQCGQQVVANDPGAWYLRDSDRDLVGYVYTDKPIYRPGHTVRTKAILRWRSKGVLNAFDRKQVEVVVSDNNEKVIFRANRPVDEFGAVNASFPIPASAALGYYTIVINSEDAQADGSFEVQEYRKPEFEVSVAAAERFIVQGGDATLTITARYYFGQPVAGGRVQYVVFRESYYSPLRWTDEGEGYGGDDYGGEQESEETTRLDAQGRATIKVPLSEDEDGRDYTLRIVARVSDASGREVSGRGAVHATVGRFLLALTTGQYVYKPGGEATVTIRAVDYQGAPQASVPVTVALERTESNPDDYSHPKITEISKTAVTTDAQGRATWRATVPEKAGSYRFHATTESDGRTLETDEGFWVPGPGEVSEDYGEDRFLELIADKRTYAPGDRARLIVKGEDFKSAVLVTKEAQDVSWHEVVRTSGDNVIEVPITEDDLGDTYVNIAFLKDDRLFRAERKLSVPPVARELKLTIEASQPVVRPRDPGIFTIKAVDAQGAPVRAQLSVGVIDEAVYGVKPDETPDPVRFFYRRYYSHVSTQFSREYSFVGYSGTQQILLARRRRPFTLADFKADRPVRPEVRKEFPDAIYWTADLLTDAAGVATVKVTYPDSLTTWRLTARAVTTKTELGSGVARTTTTKDLILRVTPPRFLTEGDEVTVPTIVHNYLPETKDVKVDFEAKGVTPAGAAAATNESSRTLQVAPNGEQRTDWTYRADKVGRATFTGVATAGADRDAVELSLPVLPYGLKRETSAVGSLTDGGERDAQLTIPAESNPGARTIEVALAPSLAGSMLGALDFLTSFPYGCTEQTLSSFLPNVMVLRALDELKLAPTERMTVLDRQITEGLKRLYDYQHEDGGWGWWKTDQNHPFMTAYAVYGLIELKERKYKVEDYRISSGARSIAQQHAEYPRAVPDLKAYLVYVLTRSLKHGVEVASLESSTPYKHAQALDDLWNARGRLSSYGRALLLLTLQSAQDSRADPLAAEVLAAVKTRGDLAWWDVTDDPLLEDFTDTSVEATALTVQALAAQDPNQPVLEQAVRWLMVNRNSGVYWSSTKQTAIVLYGLLAYLQARNERPASFTAEVMVNGEKVGSHAFSPADWTRPDPIVIRAAARAGVNDVKVVKGRGGTLYWTATARYYYNGPALTPSGSRQLALTRQYFTLTPITVRNNRRVYREQPFGGTAKPGDVILVRVTMAGSKEWKYLMMEDPIPAGTETIQRMDEYPLERPGRSWYWSQREYRDDRVVVFQQDFSQGRSEFTYLLKVVTPGVFKAMPAQVAPMYVPGVSASSGAQPFTVPPPAPAAPAGTVR